MSEEQALDELVFECVPDALIAVDRAGLIVRVNRQTETLFGQRREDLLGQPVEVLIPERFRTQHLHYRSGYLAQPVIRSMGKWLPLSGLRHDGSEFPVDVMLGPIECREGVVVLCTIRDVSDRKQAEDRTRTLEAELLHMGRLHLIGEMASDLAHELNQPLTAIVNYTHGCVRRLNTEGKGPPEVVEALKGVVRQAERAGEILKRLRNLVQRGDPILTPTSLNDLAGEIIALAMPEIRRRETKVELDLAKELPLVQADPIQIQQVILNLVQNGLEALAETLPGKRVLTISTCLDDSGRVNLAVRDRGRGLSGETLAKLFTPFFTTKSHGMGMGLAISKTIIETHGGRLWAKPQEGGGSIFQFTLPRTQAGPGNESNTDRLRR